MPKDNFVAIVHAWQIAQMITTQITILDPDMAVLALDFQRVCGARIVDLFAEAGVGAPIASGNTFERAVDMPVVVPLKPGVGAVSASTIQKDLLRASLYSARTNLNVIEAEFEKCFGTNEPERLQSTADTLSAAVRALKQIGMIVDIIR